MKQLSNRQQEIVEIFKRSNKNIIVDSVAGSGKTTLLFELLKNTNKKTLFLSFNKSIEEDTSQKLIDLNLKHGKAMTFHALGFLCLRQRYNRVKVKKGNSKNFELVKKVQDDPNSPFRRNMNWKKRLEYTYLLFDMNDKSRVYYTDDLQDLEDILQKDLSSRFIKRAWKLLLKYRKKSYENKDLLEIDFNDMIYIPVKYDLNIPLKPDILFVDEAQDLNFLQHNFVTNIINNCDIERFVAVGDERQSIYKFSGSHSDSMDLFTEKINTITMPLDICYRCSEMVIDDANEVYNVMKKFKSEKGEVREIGNYKDIKPNSMVICRNSLPLVTLYFKLLDSDKNCYIKGEDILNKMLKFLKPYKNNTVYSAKMILERKLNDLARKRDNDAKRIEYSILRENYDIFLLISDNFVDLNLSDPIPYLINKIEACFVEKENSIQLSTIHKAKGLEADNVYILNEFLIPSKFAKTDEELKQEENLRYVARTRAKINTYYLNI